MEQKILDELDKIKQLTLLNCKKALTVEDASALTNMSKSYIYKLIMRRQVPFYKSRKLVYFDRDELNAWMLSKRIKTSDEIEQEAITRVVSGKERRRYE